MSSGNGNEPILSVRDLTVRFGTKRGVAEVVNGISYDLYRGETLAIVGESGSGKSVSVLSLLKLLPEPPARVDGSVKYRGTELLTASDEELRRVRGNHIAMVFQDPMTSLNPVRTIADQLIEPLELHQDLTGQAARDRAVELLELVGIPSPEARLDEYPHQFSGGMRQRVMIAMGLSCDPDVLIADEATTALDVTTQAQITELIGNLQDQLGMAVVWITHDLAVVAGIAHRVMVMYAGQIMEEAIVDDIYNDPRHPYTRGLLGSLPKPGEERPYRLANIPGLPPDPIARPQGCPFWDRCSYRLDPLAETEVPHLREIAPEHRVACFYDLPPVGEEAAGG